MRNMLLLIVAAMILAPIFSAAQSIGCQEAYDYVVNNHDYKDSVSCYGSSMLVKVDYFRLDGQGYVVGHIKKNDNDIYGKPYIFCGISNQRWNNFKIEGMYESWGKKFHQYIMDYKCNCY